MPHRLHENVRRHFQFCCGYCGVSETDSGGELTIDHYHPLAAAGLDQEANLVYACFRCNTFKSDFWPAGGVTATQRILNPRTDLFQEHLQEEDSGFLTSLTITGAFHIETLRLNRPQLVQRRLIARGRRLQTERIARLEQENMWLRNRLDLLLRLVE